ncbi:MAG: Fe-S cluster assembly protein SufD [Bacteroidales bacterium]|nr:Fe-S cluster assembly protein SufD [Bacteroidales bacterium]MCM1146838.1 Fe-S cluster assembly protein SufD [Bacteroidales bacterium]MCM1205664.1 Fe-S cluster assembly protein SufD [Bacillota bacterium]MCM1510224.1 Fe-S cluster assembly protein SufD [Clostridium sp.]
MENSARQYVELYEQCREAVMSHSCEPMNAVREEAYEAFRGTGFPGRKAEEYKYTDIRELMAPDLGLNINRLEIPADPYKVFRCDVPNLSTQLYFVVNDTLFDKALPKRELPEGVVVDSFCHRPDIVAKYYNTLADKDAVTSLNTMLAEDGLLVYVPEGVCVDKTIQVVNILRSDVGMMVNRRVLIVAGAGASVKVLFCDHTADDRRFLTTQVTEVLAGENASIEIYGLEETHQRNTLVSNTYIRQERGSRVHHTLVTLHNGNTRQMTRLTLAGEGAECWLNGAVVADKEQHVDNNTLIDHAVPHCDSHELYKYVLDGSATGAFAGRILVRKDAQKTTSEETNQNLLATKTARMYTQPMLEIYADDVKCSHGSTVGQLSESALFYMRQRGISLEEARLLLQTAFVYEVIDNIPLEPLRDRLHYLIDKRFRGELSKCEGCKLCK